MKYPRLSSALFAAAVLPVSLFFTGCESTDAKYVDSKGPETVVSLDQINIQDWTNASDQMISSLLTSGVLLWGFALAASRLLFTLPAVAETTPVRAAD